MRKAFIFLIIAFFISGLDRYGDRTIWDLDVKGVFLRKPSLQLIERARRHGFNCIFIPQKATLKGTDDLRVYRISDMEGNGDVVEVVPLKIEGDELSSFRKAVRKRDRWVRRLILRLKKGRAPFLKVPSLNSSVFFLLTGVRSFVLKLPLTILSEKRPEGVDPSRFIAWVVGKEGLEEKILSLFKGGMRGFVLAEFSEIKEEELIKLERITAPEKAWRRAGENFLPVPFYYQETDYYCGPASVKMVIEYLTGERLSQKWLAKKMGTKGPTAGTAPRRIVEFLREYTKEPFDEVELFSHRLIEKNIKLGFPVIARVKTSFLSGWKGSYGHYVVIKGWAGAYYYVNDPVKGMVFYSKEELERAVVRHYYGPLLIVRCR